MFLPPRFFSYFCAVDFNCSHKGAQKQAKKSAKSTSPLVSRSISISISISILILGDCDSNEHKKGGLLYALALCAVSHGAALTDEFDAWLARQDDVDSSDVSLTWQTALFVPIGGSLLLLLLFYAPDVGALLALLALSATACVAVAFAARPLLRTMLAAVCGSRTRAPLWRVCGARLAIDDVAVLALGGGVLVAWLVTDHWLLSNVIGYTLVVMTVSCLRVPNLKIATALLATLFLYDIFWVFYSGKASLFVCKIKTTKSLLFAFACS